MVGVKKGVLLFAAGAVAALLTLSGCEQMQLKTDIAALVEQLGGGGGGDTTAPVPGASGLLTFASFTAQGFNAAWTPANDNVTTLANLSYKLIVSTADNITTVADAETPGSGRTVIMDWSAGTITHDVSPLTPSTRYYVVVLTKDEAGNKAAYAKREGAPRMNVKQNTTTYSSGDTHNVGTITYSINTTFTIQSTGFGVLDFTNASPAYLTMTGNTAVFSVLTQPPSDAVVPGTTRDFVIQTSWNSGYLYSTQTAAVHIPSNSPVASDFVLNLSAYISC
jgi:hypothetical protein